MGSGSTAPTCLAVELKRQLAWGPFTLYHVLPSSFPLQPPSSVFYMFLLQDPSISASPKQKEEVETEGI